MILFKFWITESCDGDKRFFHCRTRKNAPLGAKNINQGRIQGLVGGSQQLSSLTIGPVAW